MKSIAFNVQIQADFPDRDMSKKATAIRICRDINLILQLCGASPNRAAQTSSD